jgi:hypothetical protein
MRETPVPDRINVGRSAGHGSEAAFYADIVAIDPRGDSARLIGQLKAAITAYAPADYLDSLRGLLADGARLRMQEAAAQRQAQLQAAPAPGRPPLPPQPPQPAQHATGAIWRASSPPQDGSDRPGFWTRIVDVGVASVRQCRDSGFGEPSWTAALNGQIRADLGRGQPCFYPDRETAQAAILDVARAMVPDA